MIRIKIAGPFFHGYLYGRSIIKNRAGFLLGNRKFARDQEYYIKSRLLKKIKTLYGTELPLLAEKGYLAANSKNLAAFCKTPSLTDNVEIINKNGAGSGIFVSLLFQKYRKTEEKATFRTHVSFRTWD